MSQTADIHRRTLEALRDSFIASLGRDGVVMERMIVIGGEYRPEPWLGPDSEWAEPNLGMEPFTIREASVISGSRESVGGYAARYPDARLLTSRTDGSMAEAAIELPRVSAYPLRKGNPPAGQTYKRLSEDAGFCLLNHLGGSDIKLQYPRMIDADAIRMTDDVRRRRHCWGLFLHLLGWQRLIASPIRAERVVWNGNNSFTGDPESLHAMLGQLPIETPAADRLLGCPHF